jgi:hypothetical protein
MTPSSNNDRQASGHKASDHCVACTQVYAGFDGLAAGRLDTQETVPFSTCGQLPGWPCHIYAEPAEPPLAVRHVQAAWAPDVRQAGAQPCEQDFLLISATQISSVTHKTMPGDHEIVAGDALSLNILLACHHAKRPSFCVCTA